MSRKIGELGRVQIMTLGILKNKGGWIPYRCTDYNTKRVFNSLNRRGLVLLRQRFDDTKRRFIAEATITTRGLGAYIIATLDRYEY